MLEFCRENAAWLGTVLAAIITGVCYLLKKSGNNKKQVIKNVKNSNINQVGESQTITVTDAKKDTGQDKQ